MQPAEHFLENSKVQITDLIDYSGSTSSVWQWSLWWFQMIFKFTALLAVSVPVQGEKKRYDSSNAHTQKHTVVCHSHSDSSRLHSSSRRLPSTPSGLSRLPVILSMSSIPQEGWDTGQQGQWCCCSCHPGVLALAAAAASQGNILGRLALPLDALHSSANKGFSPW